MTPEMRLMKLLSSDEEKTKLASEMKSKSVSELMAILKQASKAEQPEAEQEKQADSKKEKKSSSEPEVDDHPSRKSARNDEKEEKLSPQDKMKQADAWGRELARKEKSAAFGGGSKILNRAADLIAKHKGPVVDAAKKAGKKAYEGVKNVGNRVSNIKDPIGRGAAAGGLIGGVGGAATGAILPDKDEFGRPQRMKSMLRKGVAGAVSGAASGSLIGAMQKSSSVARLEKAAAGLVPGLTMGGVGSMARNFVGQMKPVAQKAMAKAAPALKSAVGNKTMGQAAGIGAAGGAALGAVKGAVAPGKDATGQTKSRLGGALRGAAGGAVGGAALGAGAKAALPHAVNAYKAVTPGLVHG